VTFDFLDRRSAERFAELLDESTGGRRHRSRGPVDEQLAELVAVGNSLSATRPTARVEPEFRTGLRAMLVATAERDGMGRTAAADAPETATGLPTAARTGRLGHGLLGHSGRLRARGAIIIGVAAGALAVSGISAASENASPGDALYGVKRSTERAQLAMAGSDVTRGQLSLDFARTRLAEAVAMPGNDAEFGGVLDDMDADTRKGVKLLTTAAAARKDRKPLATVDTFAEGQRRMLAPVLGKLSNGNQERAQTSITLLDSVLKRAEHLRTGLACDDVVPAGSDLLGPKLKGCATRHADTAGPATSRPWGQSGKPAARPDSKDGVQTGTRSSAPAVTPSASPDAVAPPARGTRSTSPESPIGDTSVRSVEPDDEKSQQQQRHQQERAERDDPLGGLVGKLLDIE